jgi:hypothetical protein
MEKRLGTIEQLLLRLLAEEVSGGAEAGAADVGGDVGDQRVAG